MMSLVTAYEKLVYCVVANLISGWRLVLAGAVQQLSLVPWSTQAIFADARYVGGSSHVRTRVTNSKALVWLPSAVA